MGNDGTLTLEWDSKGVPCEVKVSEGRSSSGQALIDRVAFMASAPLAQAALEQFETSDMFGPFVEVPDDASIQDKLLGFFGRDPGWTPPG